MASRLSSWKRMADEVLKPNAAVAWMASAGDAGRPDRRGCGIGHRAKWDLVSLQRAAAFARWGRAVMRRFRARRSSFPQARAFPKLHASPRSRIYGLPTCRLPVATSWTSERECRFTRDGAIPIAGRVLGRAAAAKLPWSSLPGPGAPNFTSTGNARAQECQYCRRLPEWFGALGTTYPCRVDTGFPESAGKSAAGSTSDRWSGLTWPP